MILHHVISKDAKSTAEEIIPSLFRKSHQPHDPDVDDGDDDDDDDYWLRRMARAGYYVKQQIARTAGEEERD